MVNLEAGTGDYGFHVLHGQGGDHQPLRMQEHYVGVDAVSWFVQKESGFFTKRAASGTLKLSLAGETYEVGLGVYDLADGAKSAPVFDRPVLPERVYRGGPITVSARITSIGRDQAVGRLLKATASSALGVVSGMVQTAGLAGPYRPLAEAGSTLMNGVRQLLDEQPADQQLFSEGGFDYTIQPENVLGERTFVLLHRGSKLDKAKLQIAQDGPRETPLYEGGPLRDGAWLLLRFRRVAEYPLQREWYPQVRKLIADLIGLVDDVKAETVTKDQAMTSLRPGTESQPSLYDEYRRLRGVVLGDGVLTQAEAGGYAGTLSEIRRLATAAVQSGNCAAFDAAVRQFRAGVVKGQSPGREQAEALVEAVRVAEGLRPAAAPIAKQLSGIAPHVATFLPLKHMTKLHELIPER